MAICYPNKKKITHCRRTTRKFGRLASEKTSSDTIPCAIDTQPWAAVTIPVFSPVSAATNLGDERMSKYRQEGGPEILSGDKSLTVIFQVIFHNEPLVKEVESDH
jgi:hypothetical protein